MTGPVDDVLEQIVEDYLSRRTSYVRDRAYSLAYAVHYEVTVQVDATAGDPEVLIEQNGIIPVAMTDLEDIEDEAWREQCREIEEEICPGGFPEVDRVEGEQPARLRPARVGRWPADLPLQRALHRAVHARTRRCGLRAVRHRAVPLARSGP